MKWKVGPVRFFPISQQQPLQRVGRRRVLIVCAAVLLAVVVAAALWLAYSSTSMKRRDRDRAGALTAKNIPALPPQQNMAIPPETALKLNAARPFDVLRVTPARPFKASDDPIAQERAIGCLAAAAWYEAGDDAEGEQAVVQTVLNRVRHPAFPDTICGVVFQGQERTTGCQFTFTCDGSLRRTPSEAAWQRAVAISRAMLGGQVFSAIGYSTHYHADYVVPYWSPTLAKIAKVHAHIFYRWPGYWGTGDAFRQNLAAEEQVIPAIARLSPAHAPPSDEPSTQADATPAGPSPFVEKPAIQMPGISQRSMHGSTVRLAPQADTFFLQLEDRAFAGQYAISALAVCKNRPACQVYGWIDPVSIADRLPLTEAQRAQLSFFFARYPDGTDIALWNCNQVARANPQQCMQAGGPPTFK